MKCSWTLSLALLAAGCSTSLARTMPGLPFMSAPSHVGIVEAHGPYLDARIGNGKELRLLFPATEQCQKVVTPEAPVEYTQSGRAGVVEGEAGRCEAVGIIDLAQWRDRRPRSGPLGVSAGIPRDTATFRTMYEDEDVILLRGRFLIAAEIGWIGDDTVALLPNSAACRPHVQRGEATVQFHVSSKIAFRLVGEGECPILGFALPPTTSLAPGR
jgi:hypothetical protein